MNLGAMKIRERLRGLENIVLARKLRLKIRAERSNLERLSGSPLSCCPCLRLNRIGA
jgi:hypothetical protein